jgi:hypothetical protein
MRQITTTAVRVVVDPGVRGASLVSEAAVRLATFVGVATSAAPLRPYAAVNAVRGSRQ